MLKFIFRTKHDVFKRILTWNKVIIIISKQPDSHVIPFSVCLTPQTKYFFKRRVFQTGTVQSPCTVYTGSECGN